MKSVTHPCSERCQPRDEDEREHEAGYHLVIAIHNHYTF